ncbi:hypothetical protein L0663_05275 [Dyadobacter sp. CY107]|uniref:hypothetical protein n=1 Tax=Dyadobacter fanqingshengii TaxID=2906443 RepID=UPI001F33643C|nr:hypothetical protein [Dyadobacter fanqingshengii]MCF2502779.1 hypothetical protein [Dyadobacter fanqingshengii]
MKKLSTWELNKIIALILLFPPVLSVFLFTIELFINPSGGIFSLGNLGSHWTGDYFSTEQLDDDLLGSTVRGSGGYTSAAPIYLGLMAIAGAMLLKNSGQSENFKV